MQERYKTFTLLMAHISRSIRRIKSEEMAEFNLKSQHVSCLYYLYRGGALTAKELCDACEEDKANISRSIDYLEENGYLVSGAATPRRYKRHLTLTEKGEAVGKEISDKIDAVLAHLSPGLTEEERNTFYRNLTTISESLEKCVKDAL